ncbi:hypothetical protein M0R72_21305 [Candidatus Pacearchaeota archaeon]|jgi:hypothetical protein|nr:hypothetical protein [Candidatus Pacearchaeota archaeon]
MITQQQIEENQQLQDEIQQLPEEYFSTCALKFFGLEGAREVYFNLLKHQDPSAVLPGISYWIT